MAIDPAMLAGGVSGPQGISNTQTMAPPQAGGAPVDPSMMMQQPPQAPPPKPPSLIPSDVARLLAEAINNAKQEAAHGLTQYLGDARGTVHVKDADLVRAWRKRNPDIDPLYEKLMLGKSDEEIMYSMYPARRALIRFGRRTYTEQVEFAEHMQRLDQDPRFDSLDQLDDDEDDSYIPPQSKFPSKGEETYRQDVLKEREKEAEQDEERIPEEGI